MTELIREKFGFVPVSHRAGRWAMNREYFRLLHKYGYKIDCSYTPGINWRQSKERVKPDLILLDIRMTPKNGFDTLREIRDMKDRADIPVIMLTAMEDKDSVLEGITLGISDYILKPFAPDDLLSRIRRVLDGEGQNCAQPQQGGGGAEG